MRIGDRMYLEIAPNFATFPIQHKILIGDYLRNKEFTCTSLADFRRQLAASKLDSKLLRAVMNGDLEVWMRLGGYCPKEVRDPFLLPSCLATLGTLWSLAIVDFDGGIHILEEECASLLDLYEFLYIANWCAEGTKKPLLE